MLGNNTSVKDGGVIHYGHDDVYSKAVMANLYGERLLGSRFVFYPLWESKALLLRHFPSPL